MRDAYDTWLILEGMRQEWAVEAAIIYGILEPYLVSDEPVDYFAEGIPEWLEPFVEEGRTAQRFEHTAEELFIWAHEYDKEALGLENFWLPITTGKQEA